MKNLFHGKNMVHKKWKIVFKKSAFKEYKKLPKQYKAKINEVLEILQINPLNEILNIRKIQNKSHYYRIRIGNYRVVYSLQKRRLIVEIIRVGHRKDVYKFF